MNIEIPPLAEVVRPVFGSQTSVKYSGFCRHAQTEVDEGVRAVTCKSCGAVLDPFDVLLAYARRERSWHYWDAETRVAQKRVGELKAEERKIKARTKAASRKDAALAVEDERRKGGLRRCQTAEAAKEIARLTAKILRLSGADQ